MPISIGENEECQRRAIAALHRIIENAPGCLVSTSAISNHVATVNQAFENLAMEYYSMVNKLNDAHDDIHELENIVTDILHIVEVPDSLAPGLNQWCLDNIKGDYYRLPDRKRMAFTRKDMAALFKLTWG